jgi:hypothetical protein
MLFCLNGPPTTESHGRASRAVAWIGRAFAFSSAKSLKSLSPLPNESHTKGVFSNWPSPRIRHNALSKNVPVKRWSEREHAIGQTPRLFGREGVIGVVIFSPARPTPHVGKVRASRIGASEAYPPGGAHPRFE